jgi:hypothetical protein
MHFSRIFLGIWVGTAYLGLLALGTSYISQDRLISAFQHAVSTIVLASLITFMGDQDNFVHDREEEDPEEDPEEDHEEDHEGDHEGDHEEGDGDEQEGDPEEGHEEDQEEGHEEGPEEGHNKKPYL